MSTLLPMSIERCEECGFDGSRWTDDDAIAAISELGGRWRDAVVGLTSDELRHRPIERMWSIGEYVDHVREVLFGMPFVLDIAVSRPGTDLGDPPEPEFAAEARVVDVDAALGQLTGEAERLASRLAELTPEEWELVVRFDGADHDARWIARHAVHDATHHLMDVARLRDAMSG